MKPVILPALLVTLLSACGGGGGSSSNDNGGTVPPATKLPTAVNGTVEQLSVKNNSIKVNGVTLPLSDSTKVVINDQAGDAQALSVGMMVDVRTNGSQVTDIIYNAELRGMIETGSIVGREFKVAGITVVNNTNPQVAVQDGDYVEVSGIYNGQRLLARFIEQEDEFDADNAELEGTVTNLDTTQQQFTLGSLTVKYGRATETEGKLANGAWVEVEGTLSGNELIASEYDVDGFEFDGNDQDELDFEGAIVEVNSNNTVVRVSPNWTVNIDSRTQFDGGNANDLQQGKLIEVEGYWSQGAVVATEIEFEHNNDQGPQPVSNEFTIEGLAQLENNNTFTINGIEVTPAAYAEYEDVTLATLDGKWIEVEGRQLNDQLLASSIEMDRQHPTTPELENGFYEISLEGPVDANGLWGYKATDNSLKALQGQWVEVECRINDSFTTISHCVLDRD
ncbi:DUF5666 domain-containing protein [Ferrimonas senticii]|uniref:DUF5666 domain-containing protein n=1 Tax=Ferrimonas senticii TaxID=394566 RepID=UPI00040097F1|nr:DUF5666 domain-containing protein [Ferrimonas senticii]